MSGPLCHHSSDPGPPRTATDSVLECYLKRDNTSLARILKESLWTTNQLSTPLLFSIDGMSPMFGTGNGTLRSTTSTVTTPLSTPAFSDAQQPPQQPTSTIINGFDYNEKLNGTLKTNKLKVRLFGDTSSVSGRLIREGPIFSIVSTFQAFRTSSNGGSIAKHLRIHKLPQPHRCDVVFEALDEALK